MNMLHKSVISSVTKWSEVSKRMDWI